MPVGAIAAQLTLSWVDNSTTEDGFRIERRPGSSATFAQIATVAANVTSYTDGSLAAATMYCYRVQAFNTAGSSGYSNEQCATTATSPPAAAGTLQFSSATYSVNENGGSATITITRTGGSNGAVGVTFATSNGTATTAGSDYTAVSQTVSFANGDMANKTVNIPITNDSTVEPNETVNLALSSPTGGASLGSPSTAVLTIVNDDSAPSYTLTVSVAVQATSGGSASGRVVSDPVGIDCGTDCAETYTSGLPVRLTPLPGTGSVFAGWTGNTDCTDGSVTMNADKLCTANFALNQALLTVTTNGNGTVGSTAGGMTCSSSCTFPLSLGSTVTLRATPATGSSFAGWNGAGCTGTGDCTIILSTNKSVAATFVGSSSNPSDKIGIYRPSTGEWFLDLNGNEQWGDCGMVYCVSSFSSLNGVPVVGDWNGSGVTQLGLFLSGTAEWHLDGNANVSGDGCGVDICLGPFGLGADIPASGKWTARGYDRIGVFRPSTGRWYLDANGDGKLKNCRRDQCAILSVYQNGDLPVTGDWDGNGTTQLGLFRPSTGEWFLDYRAARRWNGCRRDRCITSFGTAADRPVSGDWDGTGTSKIGVFRPSTGEWFLDLNGNGQLDDCGVDLCVTNFGQAGDFPVVGKW